MPRISRAQDMDVLSSMGHARRVPRRGDGRVPAAGIFPLMMTARRNDHAGTRLILAPALRVCRRSRPAGGSAPSSKRLTYARRCATRSVARRALCRDGRGIRRRSRTTGGYARELEADAQARQHEVLAEHVKDRTW